MNRNLKPKILELRKKGYCYREIANELNCSKGTVAYHLGKNQREKTNNRTKKYRTANPLIKKRDTFVYLDHRRSYTGIKTNNDERTVRQILHVKRCTFSVCKRRKMANYMFSLDELIEHLGENPKCYLTGRKIDLSNGRSYALDHIIPRSKGGDNSLNNCGITCTEANRAKFDLNLDDFVSLCQEVVDYNKKENHV